MPASPRSSIAPIVLGALILTLCGSPLRAQSTAPAWYAGVTAALSDNTHTGGFRMFVDDPSCPPFVDGSGDGYQFGIAVRFAPVEMLAFDLRATHDVRPGNFEVALPDALILWPGSSEVVTQRVVSHSDIRYELVTVDLAATLRGVIVEGLAITGSIGPSLGQVRVGTMTQYQDLLLPPDARFTNPNGYETENEGRRLIFARDREIPMRNDERISLRGALGVELEMLDRLLVRTAVAYDRALTDVTDSENWMVHSWLAELTVMVRL